MSPPLNFRRRALGFSCITDPELSTYGDDHCVLDGTGQARFDWACGTYAERGPGKVA